MFPIQFDIYWSSSTTPSALSWIMDSMISLFENITRPSSVSLEEIKWIAIVDWIFHVSGFLRSIMIIFRYGLILVKYYSTDGCFISIAIAFILNIIVILKITYSCWFVIIFFFSILKKIPNIPYYSVFDCFIFFFQFKKISSIIDCSVIYFLFFFLLFLFSLKRFLISLIMLSFFSLKIFILTKIKFYYTPFKECWK